VRPQLKSFRYNGDFRIVFAYTYGLTAELNFAKYVQEIHGPVGEPLQDEQFFAQAYVDYGVLTWPNGYDACPDVLRFWCEQGRVCSREETDGYFQNALSRVSA